MKTCCCKRICIYLLGKNFTVSVLVSPQRGLIFYEIAEAGMTNERFIAFMTEALQERIGIDNEAVVIMDNLRAHDYECESDSHTIKFLPRYSPFLNPIESVFSAVKSAIKREISRRRIEYSHLIDAATVLQANKSDVRREFLADIVERHLLETITPQLVQNCEHHALNYLDRCLNGEEIDG